MAFDMINAVLARYRFESIIDLRVSKFNMDRSFFRVLSASRPGGGTMVPSRVDCGSVVRTTPPRPRKF
jgi:hypothetical protein